MSNAINTDDEWKNREDYSLEYRNGEYVKVMKPYMCGIEGCGMRFSMSHDLDDHMK